jgi:dUTPase
MNIHAEVNQLHMPLMVSLKTAVPWKVCVLPGGKKPVRKTKVAAGIDIFTRAIVDVEADPERDYMRRTLCDFRTVIDPSIRKHLTEKDGELAYVLTPGESVRIGLGIVVELPPNQAGYVEPRGSTANRHINVLNTRIPINVVNGRVTY